MLKDILVGRLGAFERDGLTVERIREDSDTSPTMLTVTMSDGSIGKYHFDDGKPEERLAAIKHYRIYKELKSEGQI